LVVVCRIGHWSTRKRTGSQQTGTSSACFDIFVRPATPIDNHGRYTRVSLLRAS
jgi:hypothetical protein